MSATETEPSDVRRIQRKPPLDLHKVVQQYRHGVFHGSGIEEPQQPPFGLPKLEPEIDDLSEKQLMNLFIMLTRWADYFQYQLAIEQIYENNAETEIKKLEGLYLARNRPERASEATTWVRAAMENDRDIIRARDALKLYYARRKLKQMLFEATERDAAVVSRELTRRTDTKSPGYRRAETGTT